MKSWQPSCSQDWCSQGVSLEGEKPKKVKDTRKCDTFVQCILVISIHYGLSMASHSAYPHLPPNLRLYFMSRKKHLIGDISPRLLFNKIILVGIYVAVITLIQLRPSGLGDLDLSCGFHTRSNAQTQRPGLSVSLAMAIVSVCSFISTAKRGHSWEQTSWRRLGPSRG